MGHEKIEPAFQSGRVGGFSYGAGSDFEDGAYYWEQTFPVDGPVYIRYRYRPVIGKGASLPATALLKMTEAGGYCLDGAFRASVYYKVTREKYSYASYDDISCSLAGAKNWAGGMIGNFRLVVDKGSPDALVTFCGSDIKKISPTKSEFQISNFRPRRDIHVFILRDWLKEAYN